MNKNKWLLKGLWVLGLAPVVLAWTMAYTGWGVPEARKNNGELVQAELRLPEPYRQLHKGRWGLLLVSDECLQDCQDQLYRMQQLHKSTGKEFNRLQSMWLSSQSSAFFPKLKDSEQAITENGQLISWFDKNNLNRSDFSLWLLDPEGNMVLKFSPDLTGKEMLADIKWLLKASRMG